MDWFKYDRLIVNRESTYKESQQPARVSNPVSHCPQDCWLRNYDAALIPLQQSNFQPYQPKPSQIYDRIKTTQIRVLRLHPGRNQDVIVTELLPARLTNTNGTLEIDSDEELVVPYRILSYSWGYGGNVTRIQCNGVYFEVLDSLYDALVELRDAKETLYYWIDAICINQTDPIEKAVQITKMFTLYSQATQTVVWLGRADQCGFETIRFLAEFDGREHRPECMRGIGSIFRGLESLAGRPWFERTWVRQEVFASDSIVVQVGNFRTSYDILSQHARQAMKWLSKLQQDRFPGAQNIDGRGLRMLVKNFDSFKRVDAEDSQHLTVRKYELLIGKPELSLESVLRGNKDFKATNARDYIYGIVSMTSAPTHVQKGQELLAFGTGPPTDSVRVTDRKSSLSALPIHYTRPLAQVFAEATIYVMQFHESLDLMFLNSQLPRYEPEPLQPLGIPDMYLPSWATDWRHSSRWSFLDSVWMLIDHLVYRDGPATLYGRVNSEKEKHPNQQGDCGIRRTGSTWNDRASFEKYAARRIVFSSENNSLFTDIRELMYEPAQFQPFMEDRLMKLRCVGVVLGSLTGAPAERRKSQLTFGAKKKFINKINPLFQKEQSFNVTQRYFAETIEYMKLVGSEASNACFKEMDIIPLDEISKALPDAADLYKSNKPIARFRNYSSTAEQGGWPVSQFCYCSDIGRILATSACLAPKSAQEGDLVVMFKGCSLPAVVRRVSNARSQEYQLMGPVFNWRYIAEESLRRLTAELWFQYSDNFDFFPDLERKPVPLELDLQANTFVLI